MSEKILVLDEAFDRFQKPHFEYVVTSRKHREEWEDEAHYFCEHCHKKVEFDSNVRRWIDNASKVPEIVSIAPEDPVCTAGSLRSRTSSNVALRALKTKFEDGKIEEKTETVTTRGRNEVKTTNYRQSVRN